MSVTIREMARAYCVQPRCVLLAHWEVYDDHMLTGEFCKNHAEMNKRQLERLNRV